MRGNVWRGSLGSVKNEMMESRGSEERCGKKKGVEVEEIRGRWVGKMSGNEERKLGEVNGNEERKVREIREEK